MCEHPNSPYCRNPTLTDLPCLTRLLQSHLTLPDVCPRPCLHTTTFASCPQHCLPTPISSSPQQITGSPPTKKAKCWALKLVRMQKKAREKWAKQLNAAHASWILLLAKMLCTWLNKKLVWWNTLLLISDRYFCHWEGAYAVFLNKIENLIMFVWPY